MVLGIPKKTLVGLAVLVGVVVIYALGSGRQSSEAEGGSAPTGCRVSVNADILNVRAGPGMNAEVVGKFKQDAETDATGVVRNGFRKLADNRWASDQYLEPVDGANCG